MSNDNSSLPRALRRSPRHQAVRLHASTSPSQRNPRQHAVSKSSYTPRQTKRVSPSESNSVIVRDVQAGPMTPPATATQRSTRRAISTTKRKGRSKTTHITTPDRTLQAQCYDSYGITAGCNEVRIFPLRAILDDRVKRRIRRNGLSEEMNTIYDERKQRTKKTVDEMQRLRVELMAKEKENDILREQSSMLQDTSRILDLEREISELKHGLRSDNYHNVDDDDWDMAAADGFTDGESLSDMDDRFRDDTTLEVESDTSLTHEKRKPYIDTLTAFTPPNTSPTKSASPDNQRHPFPAPHSDAGVQARFGDPDKVSLELELTQLRNELASLQKALKTSEQLESQLRAKEMSTPNTNSAADVDPDLQLQTDIMLQTLAEKTTALTDLNSLISTLGSSSSDASEIVSTLRDAFQSARKELEQIFPDDKLLPMSLEGTVILSNMIQRLRGSATQAKKDEALLEDYCIREQHLREQLNDRMDAMDTMSSKLREKDDRIFRLEADMERSEAIVDTYRKSLADASQAVEQNTAELTEVQTYLGSMISVAADLQAQLAQVQVEAEVEMTAKQSAHDEELRMRDEKLSDLHKEISALKEALTLAHDSISRLQGENEHLQDNANRDKKIARDTVAALRTQLLQSLHTSEAFLA